MTDPKALAEYVGFTDSEVMALCEEWDMDYDRMRRMYDGYSFSGVRHVYCPNSVVNALLDRKYKCYWTQTSSYEMVRTYISMDYQGLKGDIVAMLAGARSRVDIYTFENDMKNVRSRRFPSALTRYAGRILLAGISYKKDDPEKKHTCIIEEWEKE